MADYKKPSLTVDIFIKNSDNEFILVKRKNDPCKNQWALPGGFVDYGESTENAAIREAKEETSIDVNLTNLFNVYSDPNRDPRGHTVTIVYLATGNLNDMCADDDAKDIGKYSYNDLDSLEIAFDHRKILEDIFTSDLI